MVKIQFQLLNRSILNSELEVRPKLRFWALMSRTQTLKIRLEWIQLLSSRTTYNGKKTHFRLWNRSVPMSEIGAMSKLRCLAKMSMKQTRKIELQRILLLSTRTPYKWLKNQFKLLNRSILISELEVRPKLRFWALMSRKKTQKTDFKEFSF